MGQGEAPRWWARRRGGPCQGLCRGPWVPVFGSPLGPELPEHAGNAGRKAVYFPGLQPFWAETLFQASGCQKHPPLAPEVRGLAGPGLPDDFSSGLGLWAVSIPAKPVCPPESPSRQWTTRGFTSKRS